MNTLCIGHDDYDLDLMIVALEEYDVRTVDLATKTNNEQVARLLSDEHKALSDLITRLKNYRDDAKQDQGPVSSKIFPDRDPF